MIVATLGVAIPSFWFALLLIYAFSVHYHWFPAAGGQGLKPLVLPAITLGISAAAVIARLTRSSMLEVMRQDYIGTARAKGLRERAVVYRHGLQERADPGRHRRRSAVRRPALAAPSSSKPSSPARGSGGWRSTPSSTRTIPSSRAPSSSPPPPTSSTTSSSISSTPCSIRGCAMDSARMAASGGPDEGARSRGSSAA